LIVVSEAYTIHAPWFRTAFEDFGEIFRDRVALGALVRGEDYVQAVRRRRVLCHEMRAAMADLDILVSAAQPGEAPRIDAVSKWALFATPNFHIPFNLTG